MSRGSNSPNLICLSLLVAASHVTYAESAADTATKLTANPVLQDLADDSWYVAQDMPSPGASRSNAAAYSGFAFDSRHGRIVKRGGGHCDYLGTDVQEFDVLDTLSWSVAVPSVPDTEFLPAAHFDDANFPGAVVVMPDGSAPADFAAAVQNGMAAPVTRHNTNILTFIESTGEVFLAGKYTYGESGPTLRAVGCSSGTQLPYSWEPFDAWAYDTSTRRWRYLSRHNVDMEWAGCAWVPNGPRVSDTLGAVFCISEQDRTLHRYDVSADDWNTVGGDVPRTGLGINLTFSRVFRSLYFYRDQAIFRYDIAASSWDQVSTAGSVAADNESATAFDSRNNAIGVWDGDRLYVCELSNANSCTWSVASTVNMPNRISRYGVSSNFEYDPVNNVFWAANADSERIAFGAYRFKGGGGSSPPVPSPPSDLAAN